MMRKIILFVFLCLLLVYSGLSQAGLTRSCESSNHHIIGDIRLVDASIRENLKKGILP